MEERVLSLPQKTRLIKSLPSAIRSCVEDGGWQIVMPRNTSSCTIMTEEAELPMIEGDIETQQASELTRIEGV